MLEIVGRVDRRKPSAYKVMLEIVGRVDRRTRKPPAYTSEIAGRVAVHPIYTTKNYQ